MHAASVKRACKQVMSGCVLLVMAQVFLNSQRVQKKQSQNYFGHTIENRSKGLAKLGNIVVEMFPSLAARETYVADANLHLGSKEMFLNQVKNIFVSQTQICFRNMCFPVKPPKETCLETMFPQQCFLV